MRFLPFFFSQWRRILGSLAVLAALAALGWFLRFINAFGDQVGAIPFSYDASLSLPKKGPDGVPYSINNSLATFHLDVARPDRNCERLFPNYAAALKFAKDAGLPTVPSVQMIHGNCHQFDNDLCAALQAVMQTGSEHIPGKSASLQRLARKLAEARDAAPESVRPPIEKALRHVATAAVLGGAKLALDPVLASEVEARKASFLTERAISTPTGFWAEDETLRQTFLQDRYLMQGFALRDDMAVCIVLAQTIADDPELARDFDLFRALDSRLTNPPEYVSQAVPASAPTKAPSFRDITAALPAGAALPELLAPASLQSISEKLAGNLGRDAGFALINYAGSPEYDLLQRAAREGKWDGRKTSLALIIDAIRGGKLSLKPVPGSGWYAYQWYALETLLLPERAREAAKLNLTKAYKQRLEEAFKSSLAKNRETHIKMLSEIVMGMESEPPSQVPMDIHPEFSAEPTVTVYLRMARAYRFLHTALTAVLGDEAVRALRKKSTDGTGDRTLGEELNRMALLCYGIYGLVSADLGLATELLSDELSPAELRDAKEIAVTWLTNPAADPDLARDTRVATPIMVESDGAVHYWGTGGVRLQRVKYEYEQTPTITGAIKAHFVPGYYYLPTDVSLEFQRPSALTGAEFRRLCDSSADETTLRHLLQAPLAAATIAPFSQILVGAFLFLLVMPIFFGWRTNRALTRRVALSALAVATLFVMGWIAFMTFDEAYRIHFFIRHVASKNSLLAMSYGQRHFYHGLSPEPTPAALRALVDLLHDPDRQTRYLAITYLMLSDTQKLPAVDHARANLCEVALGSDPDLAPLAYYLLGMFRDDGNVAFLRAALKNVDSDEGMREAALSGLARTGDPQVIEDVIACGHSPEATLRIAAGRAIGNFDDPRSVDLIAEMLPSSDARISRAAFISFERLTVGRPHRDVFEQIDPALLAAVRVASFTPYHRQQMAREIHDVSLRVLAYESLLVSPSSTRRMSEADCQADAAEELGDLKSAAAGALPTLESTLRNPQTAPYVQIQVQKAIKSISRSVRSGVVE